MSKPSIGARLPLVERLALRHALDHVDHHDGAGEVLLGQALGRGGADVAGADDGDLFEHAGSLSCGRVEEAQIAASEISEF